MLEKEVDYRIAKWLLLNMEKDGIITSDARQSKSVIFCNQKKCTFYGIVIIGGAEIWKALKNYRIK